MTFHCACSTENKPCGGDAVVRCLGGWFEHLWFVAIYPSLLNRRMKQNMILQVGLLQNY